MKKFLIILEIWIFIGCIAICTDSMDSMDSFFVCFPILNIVIMLPLLLLYNFIKNRKNNNLQKEKQTKDVAQQKQEKIPNKIFLKCKQEGNLKDIEKLKKSIEENIKNNGSDAEFFDLNFIVAKIYNYINDKESAYKYFNKVLNIIENIGIDDLCKIADKYLIKERYYDAVCIYTIILKNFDSSLVNDTQCVPDIYFNRAIAYLGLKQNYYKNLAIEDLNTAKEKAKYIYGIFENLEKNYLTEKLEKYDLKLKEIIEVPQEEITDVAYDLANKEIEQVKETTTAIETSNYGIQAYNKGCKLIAKKDYEKAIEAFLTAFQYNVNTIDSLRNLAKAEKSLGNLESAINYYKDVLEEEPNDAIAYNNIGNIYYQMKKYDEAFNAYGKAIEIDNTFTVAISNQEKILSMREKEKQKKADLLYEQARKDYNYKNYTKAKEKISETLTLCDTQKYRTLQQKINSKIAEINALYNDALLLMNTGSTVENYQTVLKMLKKVIALNPNCVDEYSLELEKITQYIKIQEAIDLGNIAEAKSFIQNICKNSNNKKLETFNKDIENLQKQAEDFYNKTLEYIKENNFEKAKNCIQATLKIDNNDKYKKLYDEIVLECNAEKYYKSYLKEFDKKHYLKALSAINEALEILPKKTIYINALNDVTPYVADSYFQDGQKFLAQKEYEKAIDSFNNAITLDSANLSYNEQLKKAINEYKQYQADKAYKSSLNNLKNGRFEIAISNIQTALHLYPQNTEYKEILQRANDRIVDISTCNKGAILTLDGFDEEKAQQFIKDRETMNWYDLDSFAKYFDLQPHEQVLIEERIIFPLKPHAKKGRSVDW